MGQNTENAQDFENGLLSAKNVDRGVSSTQSPLAKHVFNSVDISESPVDDIKIPN